MTTGKRFGLIGVVALLGACGGASSGSSGGDTTGPNGTGTSGGDAPPTIQCSVPNAPENEAYQQGARRVEQNDASGVAMLDTACTAGNPCACSELSEVYFEGQLAPTDRDRAITLADQACEGGEIFGCWHAGAMRWLARPNETDIAIERYGVACDGENADACTELGRLAMSGVSQAGPAEAISFYDMACQNDGPIACAYQGAALSEGDAPANPARGAELLEFACMEASVPGACTEMGRLVFSTNADAARTAWQRACDAHDPFACDALLPEAEAAAMAGTAAAALDLDGTGAEHVAITAETPPSSIDVSSGGEVDIAQLGLRPSCTGVVTREADLVIDVMANVPALDLSVGALTDTTLAVRDPAGGWHCADDTASGSYNPILHVATPAAGAWTVWVGRFTPGETQATMHIGAASSATPAVAVAPAPAPAAAPPPPARHGRAPH